MKIRDIISINDFKKEDVLHILKVAKQIEEGKIRPSLEGKILATLFYEPSTRTRFSFESAMEKLGGKVISMAEAGATSVVKGESLHDTAKTVERYADIIVIRHPQEGSARWMAESMDVPVINGGDGANQHPTQTLLDLYAIKNSQRKLNNLTIGMIGDLKYGRTVHSLTHALSMFNTRLYFISPKSLVMPEHILKDLKHKKIKYSEHETVERIINKLDILYATRIQKERFADPAEYEKVKYAYKIDELLFKKVKKNFRILHPLPRVQEISLNVDKTPYAFYFKQVGYGIPVRQAVLSLLLGKVK